MRTLIVAVFFWIGAAAPALAQVSVDEAWVRGTVAQQKATGLFARIVSASGGRLVGVSTPVAGVAEIHEMKLDGGTMRMRAIPALALPPGRAVELAPGGHHIMLMDLREPLKAGDKVPVTLVVETADGRRENVQVMASVRALGVGATSMHDAHGR